MKSRHAAAALLLAALAGGCGAAASAGGGGPVLRYAYQPGQTLAYDMEASLRLDMTAEGDEAAAVGMDYSMVMAVTARLDLAFAPGPSPDTIEITLAQELLEGGASVTTMGQELLLTLEDLAAEMDREVVLVVDPQGRAVSATVDGIALPAQLLAGVSGFGGSDMLTPSRLGPEFPATGLEVGTEWETEDSTEVLGLAYDQHGSHRVVGQEELGGRAVYRIDSRLTTGAMRADLAALMEELQAAPELLRGTDPAQLDAALAQFQMMGVSITMVMEESTALMTTWFDPAAGIVVRAVLETPMTLRMTMRGFPGSDVEVVMEMVTEQRLDLAL